MNPSALLTSTYATDEVRWQATLARDPGFEQLVAHVVGLIETPSIGLNLPLDVRGTAFQERVWRALHEIPPGITVSYAEIAERIDTPKAVRRDGDISGYRWGMDRKRELLRREAEA